MRTELPIFVCGAADCPYVQPWTPGQPPHCPVHQCPMYQSTYVVKAPAA